jgi:Spy/CpxP family protein refolding chaperone
MEKYASLEKGMQMNMNLLAKHVAIAAGLFFLLAVPRLILAQSGPPAPMQASPMASPAARTKSDAGPMDVFAGLTYTDEQKAKIDAIHQDIMKRKDTVANSEKLNADQKEAMVTGYDRIERTQVFEVLTADQQKEVLKRERARRAAKQPERNRPPLPQ